VESVFGLPWNARSAWRGIGVRLGAEYADSGLTGRRQILALDQEYIGKEAHNWEQQVALGSDPEMQTRFGMPADALERRRRAILKACKPFGVRELAREAGLAASAVSDFVNGRGRPSPEMFSKLAAAVPRVVTAHAEEEMRRSALLAQVRELCDREGILSLARRAQVDPANLRSILSGRRRAGGVIARRLEVMLSRLPD